MSKFFNIFAVLSIAIFFASCGDDSGNNSSNENYHSSSSSVFIRFSSSINEDSFSTFYDSYQNLIEEQPCTPLLSQSLVHITSTGANYICKQALSSELWSWQPYPEETEIAENLSSKEETLSSSSFTDTTTKEINNSHTISGFAQKGPFTTGSIVNLYVLDETAFNQTTEKFTGKISNEKGTFTIKNIKDSIQYILLTSTGYYKNEVSGEKSSGMISLDAITKFKEHEETNINILTHLLKNRFIYLVKTGVEDTTALKQAKSDVLSAFYLNEQIKNFEKIEIFGDNNDNAILLAISIIMQNKNNIAELRSLITEFESDIEKDGKWNDSISKTKIADWLSAQDLNDSLKAIRNNVENWKLGKVPNFEKYIRKFWYTNYNLGECTSSLEGVVLPVANIYSSEYNSSTRFICKNEMWVEASRIEKDTYQWAPGEDGELKTGDITRSWKYIYDAISGCWRDAISEENLFGGCTENQEGKILSHNNLQGWFICESRKWSPIDTTSVDTYDWIAGLDGDIKKGDSTEAIYKYDENQHKWLIADQNDILQKIGCTTNRVGTRKYVINSDFEYEHYYCSKNGWVFVTNKWDWNVPKEARFNPDISYDSLVDSRDGKVYKTIKIGEQEWMAENLNYVDSTKYPVLKGLNCWDNEERNCDVAGRHYTWAQAVVGTGCGNTWMCSQKFPVQGVCPNGWHIPSNEEWNTLFKTVGGYALAGRPLKSQTGWINRSGTDPMGLSVLPVGVMNVYENYSPGRYAFFWCADEGNRTYALRKVFSAATDTINGQNIGFMMSKEARLSIRCVKN